MVGCIEGLRARDLTIDAAVREGAAQRLRTVLMTALLAMLGLLPMALSHDLGSKRSAPGCRRDRRAAVRHAADACSCCRRCTGWWRRGRRGDAGKQNSAALHPEAFRGSMPEDDHSSDPQVRTCSIRSIGDRIVRISCCFRTRCGIVSCGSSATREAHGRQVLSADPDYARLIAEIESLDAEIAHLWQARRSVDYGTAAANEIVQRSER